MMATSFMIKTFFTITILLNCLIIYYIFTRVFSTVCVQEQMLSFNYYCKKNNVYTTCRAVYCEAVLNILLKNTDWKSFFVQFLTTTPLGTEYFDTSWCFVIKSAIYFKDSNLPISLLCISFRVFSFF